MIVSGIRAEEDAIHAEVSWEDMTRQPLDLYVRGPDLHADPNGFLLLCFIPAWKAGERRVVIEGGVCPVLKANLSAAAQTLARWHPMGAAPAIEGPTETRLPQGKIGQFLSGGIDSLASLRTGLERVPHAHPETVSAAILVGGATSETKFARLRDVHQLLADGAGVRSIALRTSAQSLHNDNIRFYIDIYHGAFLAGLAHFLGGQLRKVRISATFDAKNLEPWGSHPLLDPFYSSAHMAIEHHGLEMSRFAKTAIVADWPLALAHVNVCISPESDGVNCGRCEKCLRTMLALIALGKLHVTAAFPARDLRAEDLARLKIGNAYQASCYRDLLAPLRDRGRSDLAAVVERKLSPPSRLAQLAKAARETLRPRKRVLEAAFSP